MALLIGFLTFILVVNCLFLMLLVLIQLPKKEAGAGVAFGGGATDALFGAGSGNALTKLTKYSAGLFLGLALILTTLYVQQHGKTSEAIARRLAAKAAATPAPAPALPAAKPGNTLFAPLPNAGTPTTTNPGAPALTTQPATGTPQLQLPPPNQTTPAPVQPTPNQGAAPATPQTKAPATTPPEQNPPK